ncbi:hypothetical protein SynROS8604_02011 [Synechococcus sp. ROS8604]|nr:hypothetical protein SynROS8604_02011 [Synechococcus sp. ROS8604]
MHKIPGTTQEQALEIDLFNWGLIGSCGHQGQCWSRCEVLDPFVCMF